VRSCRSKASPTITSSSRSNPYAPNHQGSHDSVEDAKAALALFRFKADILDKLGISTDTCNYDYVEKIAKDRRVIVFDKTNLIRGLLSYGIEYEEIKNNSPDAVLEKVHKHVKHGKTDMIFANVQMVPAIDEHSRDPQPQRSLKQQIDQSCESINKKMTEIYKDAQEDTSSLG